MDKELFKFHIMHQVANNPIILDGLLFNPSHRGSSTIPQYMNRCAYLNTKLGLVINFNLESFKGFRPVYSINFRDIDKDDNFGSESSYYSFDNNMKHNCYYEEILIKGTLIYFKMKLIVVKYSEETGLFYEEKPDESVVTYDIPTMSFSSDATKIIEAWCKQRKEAGVYIDFVLTDHQSQQLEAKYDLLKTVDAYKYECAERFKEVIGCIKHGSPSDNSSCLANIIRDYLLPF